MECWQLTGRLWLLPVLESRPANTMGSRAPSSSGNATCMHPYVSVKMTKHIVVVSTLRTSARLSSTGAQHWF